LNVTATFFIIAQRLGDKFIDSTLKRMYNEGHLIGSHTWDHRDLKFGNGSTPALMNRFAPVTYEVLRREILYGDFAVSSVIGQRPLYFRFPYSNSNDTVQQAVLEMGYYVCEYNVNSGDTSISTLPNGATAIFDSLTKQNISDSGIITIQHDTLGRSAGLTKEVVKYYQGLGYKFVTYDVCIGSQDKYHPSDPLFQQNANYKVSSASHISKFAYAVLFSVAFLLGRHL